MRSAILPNPNFLKGYSDMPSHPLPIGFENDLTIRYAAKTKEALADGLLAESTLSLAINPEAAVDLSFLQLVAAARLHARRAGGGLAIAEPAGPKLREVLDRAGFLEDASAEDLNFWLHTETAQ